MKIYIKVLLHYFILLYIITFGGKIATCAEIAQSVEHFTRNEGVVGSIPIFSL